jgi:hypothetical protein
MSEHKSCSIQGILQLLNNLKQIEIMVWKKMNFKVNHPHRLSCLIGFWNHLKNWICFFLLAKMTSKFYNML